MLTYPHTLPSGTVVGPEDVVGWHPVTVEGCTRWVHEIPLVTLGARQAWAAWCPADDVRHTQDLEIHARVLRAAVFEDFEGPALVLV